MTTGGKRSDLFPEWSELHSGQPVRQGDVLAAIRHEPDAWRELLVVLTADCDLARAKHGGALSCVPLLTHGNYLLTFRFEKLRDSFSDKLTGQMLDAYCTAPTFMATSPRISRSRMREWVVEAEVASVALTLKLEGEHAARFQQFAEAFRGLVNTVPTSLDAAVRMLAEAKLILGESRTIEKCINSVANEFASSLRTLPGDALYLNEVSPEHTQGYVAYLRRIIEVREGSVVRSRSRMPHDACYLRISRLRSPYVYAMSQQFASVFSAIGLPVEYEDARDVTLERIRKLEIHE